MSKIPTSLTIERLLDRFHNFASEYPFLGHGAIRAKTKEWPFEWGGDETVPGLTVQQAAPEFRRGERMPIPLRPHWLHINGMLYQSFFLLRIWDWNMVDLAERAVQHLLTLNEEAASLCALAQAQPSPTDTKKLPSGVNEVDRWMGYVYETLSPEPQVKRDKETLLLPGNVFAAVARVVEQLEVPVRQARLPVVSAEVSDEKPADPTQSYCLAPPNFVQWVGKIEVQQRLWHLLGALVDCKGAQISFDEVEEKLYPGKPRIEKRLQNDVSALNKELVNIKWPFTYHTKSTFIQIERCQETSPPP